MTQPLVDLARARAEEVLAGNGGPVGILARRSDPQVRARDSMVCGLGLMVARDGALRELHARSLATLAQHQSPRGTIDHAGAIDSNLWFILGHHARLAATGDAAAVVAAWDALRRAYTWLQYQDSNECGLLEAHEAKDWADLFANRYNTLFANALWYAAQRAMARLARAADRADEAATCDAAAGDVRFKLNQLLWVGPEVPRDHAWIAAHRAEWSDPTRRIDAELQDRPHYLPYVGVREYGDRFDTFGNLLAILFGVADARQTARIFEFIRGAGLAKPWPIRAVYPVVHPGDRDWREYYRLRNLNLPHQYQNGGAWPFIGGFYVAALVKARRLGEAAVMLERLAQMNRRGVESADAWEFNEWFHGESARPMGSAHQSWSAAMFVYAHECVERGACPFFEDADW